jgi:hypothetical protein
MIESEFSHTVMHGAKPGKAAAPGGQVARAVPAPRPSSGLNPFAFYLNFNQIRRRNILWSPII